MPESGPFGSVRGVCSDAHPYRDARQARVGFGPDPALRGMAERSAGVPPEWRIEFRVGINVGDIILDGEDFYGGGANEDLDHSPETEMKMRDWRTNAR